MHDALSELTRRLTLNETGPYDSSLHMFVHEVRSPDPRRLRFMRWLVEHNHFGRPPEGPASGYLAHVADEEITPSVDSRP
jgi:hypothetical protein